MQIRNDFGQERLRNITEKTMNRRYPLNPQQFPKAFEFNEDYA